MLDIVPYLQKKKQTEYSKTVYISELDSYTMSEKLGPDKAPIKSKIVEEQLSDQHLESFNLVRKRSPPLSPLSIPSEFFWCTCLGGEWGLI